MNISDRATVALIFKSLADVGASAPKPVVDAHEHALKVSEAARAMHPGQDGTSAAVLAALSAGKDPGEDKAVIRALTLGAIANPGITAAVDNEVYGRLQEACRAHADDIVNAWRTPFNKAASALVVAHGILGAIDLSDTTSVVKIGAQATDAWSAATKAVKAIDTIVNGWTGLGEFTHLAPRNPFAPALRLVDADYQQWGAHQLERRRLEPWDAVREDLELSLPTFDEYHQRIAAIDQAARRAQSEYEEDRQARMSGRRRAVVLD